jgi:hypothetical protein
LIKFKREIERERGREREVSEYVRRVSLTISNIIF